MKSRNIKARSKLVIRLITILIVIVGGAALKNIYINNSTTSTTNQSGIGQEEAVKEKGDGEADLPRDFPNYPSATVVSSYSTQGDKKATSVVWKTDATLSAVSDFYKNELEKAGWTVTSNIENENSNTYSFEKNNKFGFIGIGKGEGGVTIISVTIGER